MPWTARDVAGKTKKATTAKLKREWLHVANGVLAKTGDEARAIREANGVIAGQKRGGGTRPKKR